MIRFTRIFIRPHADIDFYNPGDDFLKHVKETYIDTGMCTKFREKSFKDSGNLVLELVSEWSADIDETITENDDIWAKEIVKENEYNQACEIILAHKDLETI